MAKSPIPSAVLLDDGTPIILDGQIVDNAPSVSLTTTDFSARGGDQYPFGDAPFTNVGITYQQVLANFLSDDLENNVVSEAEYPEGGEGRILITDQIPSPPAAESIPESSNLLGLGLVGLGFFVKRKMAKQ